MRFLNAKQLQWHPFSFTGFGIREISKCVRLNLFSADFICIALTFSKGDAALGKKFHGGANVIFPLSSIGCFETGSAVWVHRKFHGGGEKEAESYDTAGGEHSIIGR